MISKKYSVRALLLAPFVLTASLTAATVTAVWDPTDATEEIRNAIIAAGEGGTVIIPAQSTPWLVKAQYGAGSTNPDYQRAVLLDQKNLTFQLQDGATLKAMSCEFTGEKHSLIWIRADGVTIKGAGRGKSKIEMRRSELPDSQFRHCVLVGAFDNITIRDLSINQAVSDGINFVGQNNGTKYTSNNAYVYNVSIYQAGRNGISASSMTNLIIDTVTVDGSIGNNPESGIDVELDHTYQRVQNLEVKNCTFKNNNRNNIKLVLFNYHNNSIDNGVAPGNFSVKFTNCRSENAGQYGLQFGGPSGAQIDLPKNVATWATVEFNNLTITNPKSAGIAIGHWYADCGMVAKFTALNLQNSGRTVNQAPVFFEFGKSTYSMGDLQFLDSSAGVPCKISDDRDIAIMSAPTGAIQTGGFKDITGRIDVTLPAGVTPRLNLGTNLNNVSVSLY